MKLLRGYGGAFKRKTIECFGRSSCGMMEKKELTGGDGAEGRIEEECEEDYITLKTS